MPQYQPSLMLGLILSNIPKCWSKFPWPFVAVEMFGLVSLGLVTPWSCVYLPSRTNDKITGTELMSVNASKLEDFIKTEPMMFNITQFWMETCEQPFWPVCII